MTKVLIVDHNPRDHERCGALLEGLDIDVLSRTDGDEVLGLIVGEGSCVDLVVILWELDGEPSGPELLTALRRAAPELPVIVISGLLDFSRAVRAQALGARDFLLKPIERDRFRKAVETALCPTHRHPLLDDLKRRVLGESHALTRTLTNLARVIPEPEANVLLIGENGTGKELLARACHDLGPRKDKPWVAVNVAALPPLLVESELFGHEKGSFTGASARHRGVFERSGEGTLFLDEIGELDVALQAKLLRAIEARSFCPVGGTEVLRFSARLVCATNRDLISEVRVGRFRQDLYFRIAGNQIQVPALRDRDGDLWRLIEHFLPTSGQGGQARLSRETKELLAHYPFPGNVRELEHVIKRALLTCEGGEILPYHLPVEIMQQRQDTSDTHRDGEALSWPERWFDLPQKEVILVIERAFNRAYLLRKLRAARGNVTRAARSAGLDPKTFRKKWQEANLGPLSTAD